MYVKKIIKLIIIMIINFFTKLFCVLNEIIYVQPFNIPGLGVKGTEVCIALLFKI